MGKNTPIKRTVAGTHNGRSSFHTQTKNKKTSPIEATNNKIIKELKLKGLKGWALQTHGRYNAPWNSQKATRTPPWSFYYLQILFNYVVKETNSISNIKSAMGGMIGGYPVTP
mmetsp:Transcript_10755/g.17625  ORF Transcript_10755/g.17625 Transcript_10755/m.17625 type:complete len:113 (-) Transcript_10755:463-801(-)